MHWRKHFRLSGILNLEKVFRMQIKINTISVPIYVKFIELLEWKHKLLVVLFHLFRFTFPFIIFFFNIIILESIFWNFDINVWKRADEISRV